MAMTGLTNTPRISVVVPVYKEEQNIRPFLARLEPVLERISSHYEILFVLDPSPDRTFEVIETEAHRNKNIGVVQMSRRFGQPAASLAGIHHCSGETCVVIDVDLQDPPELIAPMFQKILDGNDVVYAQRSSRKGETWAKRLVSYIGYKVIHRVSDVHIPPNTGDFRIMNRRVIENIKRLRESHGFLRGLVAFVGFKQSSVIYDRDERFAGAGKYNRFTGSLKIGFNGLVGFSNFLLSFVLLFGVIVSLLSFAAIAFILFSKFVLDRPYPMGVPTTISLILFMGGVQLISIGVLGEYIGRIYDEVKQRPVYIIDKILNVRVDQSQINGRYNESDINRWNQFGAVPSERVPVATKDL